jgi:hypothetical protein
LRFCEIRLGLWRVLALITGVVPEIIASQNNGAHYSDRFMTRFLQARGFRTLRLTPSLVTEAKRKIGPDHVLLVSQLFRRGEGTWGVVFDDFYYHNFQGYALSVLAFLNKPLLSAHVVFHPKWRIAYRAKEPKLKPAARVVNPRLLRSASAASSYS